jgi:hypothetical protein
MRRLFAPASIAFVLITGGPAHAGWWSSIRDTVTAPVRVVVVPVVKTVAPIVVAPVVKPVEVVVKAVKGQQVSVTDVVGVAVPAVGQLEAAANQGVPVAKEAHALATAPVTVPIELVAGLKNFRARTEELQQTIAQADATLESIQQAANAAKQASVEATDTIKDADVLVAQGQQIILRALAMLDKLDIATADGRATLQQVNELLKTGQQLILMGAAKPGAAASQ